MSRKNRSKKEICRVPVMDIEKEINNCSPARARILLTKKKATIVSISPFKIQINERAA